MTSRHTVELIQVHDGDGEVPVGQNRRLAGCRERREPVDLGPDDPNAGVYRRGAQDRLHTAFLAGLRLHTDGSALQVAKVRDIIGPEVEMMAAAYLKNSGPCADWCDVDGFDTILDEAITLCESAHTSSPAT